MKIENITLLRNISVKFFFLVKGKEFPINIFNVSYEKKNSYEIFTEK